MIINNTSVRGFFLYSETAKYEAGDFVVEGDIIYVCSPQNNNLYVLGEKPSKSKQFYMYLGDGDQMSSIQDFVEFVENEGGNDKYISLATLIGILNTFCKGVNTSGIIGEGIEYTISGDTEVTIGGSDEFTGDSVLSDLMLVDSINHGIFKVSRSLPEIEVYVPKLPGVKSEYCILKQYSYYSGINKIRVQELIDHELGEIYFRTADLNTGGISKWELATAHAKAKHLCETYIARMRGFTESLKSLSNCFCFSNLVLPSDSAIRRFSEKIADSKGKTLLLEFLEVENAEEDNSNLFSINQISDLSSVGPITLNLVTLIDGENNKSGSVWESNSITVDLALIELTGEITSHVYKIKNDLSVEVFIDFANYSPSTSTENTSIPSDQSGVGEYVICAECGQPIIPEEKDPDPEISVYICTSNQNTKILSAYYRKYYHQ